MPTTQTDKTSRVPAADKSAVGSLPKVAVIGGSQAYDLLHRKAIHGERLDRIDTPYGSSQPIYRVETPTASFYFLSRHGEKSYSIGAPFVNYRANIYALKELGVESILAWSGPGAINLKYLVGQFVLVDDIIDETKNRESTFFRFKGLGFIRQNPVFCPTIRKTLASVLADMKLDFSDSGTYVTTEGPRLETPAEIRKYASYGGDLVGMTIAPECFLARELEMCYAAICYVTNYAEGVRDRPYRKGRLFEGLADRGEQKKAAKSFAMFPTIITRFAERILGEKPICRCRDAMLRYKKRGDIAENWREWLKP
jgi:5'-methylthioadenosine phosphorylase